MSKKNNAKCAICGRTYNYCPDCNNAKTFTPWRTIVDTVEHYKIYLIIRDYTNGDINISEAKNELKRLDLSDVDNFDVDVKNAINKIINHNTVPKMKKASKVKENSEEIEILK